MPPRTPTSLKSAKPSPRGFTAIIVDDQHQLAEALAQRLALDGFETVVTTTATEALRLCMERRYDLAFVDLKLPDMSGGTVVRELKRRSPGSSVVLMTGFAASLDDPELAAAGADAVLPKPWRATELSCILEKVAPEA